MVGIALYPKIDFTSRRATQQVSSKQQAVVGTALCLKKASRSRAHSNYFGSGLKKYEKYKNAECRTRTRKGITLNP